MCLLKTKDTKMLDCNGLAMKGVTQESNFLVLGAWPGNGQSEAVKTREICA